MKLNNHSYVHKQIYALCYAFEQSTGLKLITNLSEDFTDVRFQSPYSYVTIDYQHNAIFLMCIKLKKEQLAMAQDIILLLSWLLTGNQVEQMLTQNRKFKKGGESHYEN